MLAWRAHTRPEQFAARGPFMETVAVPVPQGQRRSTRPLDLLEQHGYIRRLPEAEREGWAASAPTKYTQTLPRKPDRAMSNFAVSVDSALEEPP